MKTYTKMDPVAKAEWVEALRSGRYPQGSLLVDRSVRGVISHCCLGVLCLVKDMPIYKDDGVPDGFIYKGQRINSWPAAGFCGLTEEALTKCIKMNDSEKLKFPEIADWIEENL